MTKRKRNTRWRRGERHRRRRRVISRSDIQNEPDRPHILCIDDDRDISATVQAILVYEGYNVSCLNEITDEALHRAIDQLEPDCILLDSASATSYSRSWEAAAWIQRRARPIPVVMFSAHVLDSREAQANLTARSRDATFAAVLLKPFSIDELLAAVTTALEPVVRPRGGQVSH